MTFFSILYILSAVLTAIILGGMAICSKTATGHGYRMTTKTFMFGLFCVLCPLINTLVVSTTVLFWFMGNPRGAFYD